MTEQEQLEMYEKYTTRIPEIDSVRAISFNIFKALTELIEHKAYVRGIEEGLDHLEKAVSSSLNAINA